MKKLKVAIVHEMLVKMGGAERVIDSLQKIFPDAPIYTLLYDEKKCGATFPKEKVISSRLQKYFRPRQLLVGKMPRAIEDFDFSAFDVVISSSSAFAHGIITPSTVPHICYTHAPMRYVWDYTHEYTREKTKGWKKLLSFPLLSLMHRLRIWDYAAGERPDFLLANSQTTQKRIQKFWRRDSQVLYPPVDTKKFQKKNTQAEKNGVKNDDYYLIVSVIEPFKKIDIAVEAFANDPKLSGKKLIVIGDGSAKSSLKTIAQNGKNPENIQFLGRRSDEEVVEYMQQCKAFVFPGLEDFGITPVEAMACEKPVIFYNKGGVTETVIDYKKDDHNATGVSFEEQTSSSLAKAIELFETPKVFEFLNSGEQKEKMRQRAEEFSEAVFKKNIEAVVEKALQK
jgi:glycosyltransferase involved in cell wall biosynthesis